MKPVITIKEARKIMGKEAEKYTDDEIAKMVDDLDFIARLAIKDFKEKRLESASEDTKQS